MSRDSLKRVRDPIHGLIELEPAEWDVIDTPIFQRLRGVQQLAMTHLVYPGARHSRFEHSIGCCELAGRVARTLKLPEEEQRLVRFAALLHDVGHGPFSHVSDAVFGAFIDPGRKASKVHEHISAAVVRHDPQIREALGGLAEPVADLLAHRGAFADRTLTRDIVSGPADIDKLDYLLRDSHHCGVNYGRYDLEKLVSSVVAIRESRHSYLGYRGSAVYALEEMLLARYHMHRQVYGHKTRIASNLALTRAMILGVEEEVLPNDVFGPPPEPDGDFVRKYAEWTDSRVVHRLLDAGDGSRAREFMRAVTIRRLPKRVLTVDGEDLKQRLSFAAQTWLSSPSASVATGPQEAEAHIAAALKLPPDCVFVQVEAQDDPVSKEARDDMDENDVLLQFGVNERRPLHQVSQVFGERGVHQRFIVTVFVWPLGGQSTDNMGWTVNDVLAEAVERAVAVGEE